VIFIRTPPYPTLFSIFLVQRVFSLQSLFPRRYVFEAETAGEEWQRETEAAPQLPVSLDTWAPLLESRRPVVTLVRRSAFGELADMRREMQSLAGLMASLVGVEEQQQVMPD
jgi:hypothetical protein